MHNLCPEFKKKLKDQGYDYSKVGSLLDPTGTKLYVDIPKNASSFVSELLWNSGWIHTTEEEVRVVIRMLKDQSVINEIVVVLRDPIDRWISGIAQYAMSHLLPSVNGYVPTEELFNKYYNHLTEKLLFNTLMFDDHTMPQYYFIQDIYPEIPRKYYRFSSSLSPSMIETLKLNPNKIPEDTKNIRIEINDKTDSRLRKRVIVDFIFDKIMNNQELYNKVKEFYQKDYDLIAQADFIND